MTRSIRCLLCFFLFIFLVGCGPDSSSGIPTGSSPTASSGDTATQTTQLPTQETTEASTTTTPSQSTEPPDEILELLSGMTLRDKVGQLFIVAPEALETVSNRPSYHITTLSDTIRQQLQQYPVGGIILFGGNIQNPQQLTAFNADWQAASTLGLFLCVDEEGGAVARLANNKAFDLPKYKNAATVGKSGDPADGLEMGRTIGTYLRQYGFNLNFAPVADVNTNPKNTVIGNRAFSSDPGIAADMVAAVAQGLREQGIIPTLKHFPGHGDTAEDSHYGLASSYKTREEMLACEWIPFRRATDLDCVMTGHIATPEVTGNMLPATLSYQMVTEILKGELGFRGLVITDSLSMGAITDSYNSGEAALGALQAGCDLLLLPQNLTEAFDAVVSAVEDGTFSASALDAIVYRILSFKQAHGIL